MIDFGIELELSEGIFLEISNNINDLIYILNPELEIEFVNEKVHLKLLGFSYEDLIERKIGDFINVNVFKKFKEKVGSFVTLMNFQLIFSFIKKIVKNFGLSEKLSL